MWLSAPGYPRLVMAPWPWLSLSQELLPAALESARAPEEHLTRQLLSWTKLQEGKFILEPLSAGQQLECGEQGVCGTARLLLCPPFWPRLQRMF